MKNRFSRLLAACELLARDESAALTRRDFETLVSIQQVKSVLLADLATQGPPATRDTETRARLVSLLEAVQKNSRILSGIKLAAGERLRDLRAAAGQLHALRSTYTSGEMPRKQAFCVHV
jgi:hypothetical protein